MVFFGFFYQFLKRKHLCLTQTSVSIISTVHRLFIMCDMQTVYKSLWICKKGLVLMHKKMFLQCSQ